MADIDRVLRVVVGVFLLLGAYCSMYGMVQIVFYIIALVLILTGFAGYCPLYEMFNLGTKQDKQNSIVKEPRIKRKQRKVKKSAK